MAQTKTTSRSSTKKSTSTASRSGGSRKTTSSGRKRTSSSGKHSTTARTSKSGSARSSSSTRRTSSAAKRKKRAPARKPIRREVGCGVLLFLGLVAVIAYFPVNAFLVSGLRDLLMSLTGWGFYLWPVCLLWGAFILGFHRGRPVAARLVCVLCLPVVFGTFIHILFFRREMNLSMDLLPQLWVIGRDLTEHSGGVVSGLLGIILKKCIGIVGSFLVVLVTFVLLLLKGFNLSFLDLWEEFRNRAKLEYEMQEKEEEEEPIPEEDYLFPPYGDKRYRILEPPPEDMPVEEKPPEKKKKPAPKKGPKRELYDQSKEDDSEFLPPKAKSPEKQQKREKEEKERPVPVQTARIPEKQSKPAFPGKNPESATEQVEPLDFQAAAELAGVQLETEDKSKKAAAEPAAPPRKREKIDTQAEAEAVAKEIEAGQEEKPAYAFPPVDLLNSSGDETYDDGEGESLEQQLQNAVRSFGVGASVVGAVHGPTITRYEMKLDQGVKLNKITNLAGDIALSLGVKSVRIAPVPDKISTVGIEVPNRKVRTVWLGDLVGSDTFRNDKNKLCVALGKDIGGNVVVSNIAKMPHVLIAGTTGSGKSVCVNSMILSLLYKSTPEEVRMIMIDPKMVEFVVYNGMPHLYVPVVTDAKKAAGALQWAVVEMLKRYRLFSENGVRELASYNAIMRQKGEAILPQVVIFIDELADLMMVASKEVEEAICRVAQMGRAAGMHLVIATQSPRADVITGLMKANIPSRIALAVSGPLESRIILDQQGAEKLLGNGDMLYSPIGSKPVRLQGAFVTDEEREEIINFVKTEAEAEYSDEILAEIEKASADKDQKNEPEEETGKNDYDELLPQAVDVIFETKQASVSMLQRRLKLGYARAARLIDQLEEVGVVGPYEGSKPRQIMITKQQWQEMQYAQGTAPVDSIAHEFGEVADSDAFARNTESEEDDFPEAESPDGEGELP